MWLKITGSGLYITIQIVWYTVVYACHQIFNPQLLSWCPMFTVLKRLARDYCDTLFTTKWCHKCHTAKEVWARFLSPVWSKLRLCLTNHRAGYYSNLACDWLSTVWAYLYMRHLSIHIIFLTAPCLTDVRTRVISAQLLICQQIAQSPLLSRRNIFGTICQIDNLMASINRRHMGHLQIVETMYCCIVKGPNKISPASLGPFHFVVNEIIIIKMTERHHV